VSSETDVVVAEAEITRLLHRYAHSVDQGDLEAVRACYWDDGRDTHPDFAGTADEYVAWLRDVLPGVEKMTHQMTTVLVDLDADGSQATSVAYCLNMLITAGPRQTLQTLRYRDRLARRGGEWRVVDRVVDRQWRLRDLPG
jgi:hypothetical protein